MSLEKAKKYLEEKGFADRIIILEESTATVTQAADALGVSKEWIRCAVKDKYLQCPQGIYPMSWFFTRESMSDE